MDQSKIEVKKEDVVKWSMQAFTDDNLEDSLNNTRKAGEAICKVVILKHYGDTLGGNIILGKQKPDGKFLSKPKELDFSGLINVVSADKNPSEIILTHKKTRHKIKATFEVIRTYCNPGSHDPNDKFDVIRPMDKIHSLTSLSMLLYWIFVDYLNGKMSYQLIPHVNYNLGTMIEKELAMIVSEKADLIINKLNNIGIVEDEIMIEYIDNANSIANKMNPNTDVKRDILQISSKLKDYNSISRKPGQANILKSFIEENKIIDKIKNVNIKMGIRG